MATEGDYVLLMRSDPSKLLCEVAEQQERGESGTIISYLMYGRQKQRIFCQQLCMWDEMTEFLKELTSPCRFLNDQCPQTSDIEAPQRWKALKREYQDGLAEVGALIDSLQKQSDQLQERKDRLQTIILMLEKKKEEADKHISWKKNQIVEAQKLASLEFDKSLYSAQHVLRSCDWQLGQLKMGNDTLQSHLAKCAELQNQLWSCLEVTHGLIHYRVMCVGPSGMCVELRHTSGKMEPLKLSVTFGAQKHFHLQETEGLLEKSVKGPVKQLSAVLLEVFQHYITQGSMTVEVDIGAQHSRN